MSLREFIFSAQDRLQKEYRGAGVAVFSGKPHVVTKGLDMGQSDDLNNSVFHFAGLGWENLLEQFVASLSPTDISSCMAIRYSADEPVEPWRSTTLADLVTQVSGKWFNDILEQDRLISHYQPIYNLKSCKVLGFEALARGVDSSGLRSGFELVSAAARLGLKTEFDQQARLAAIACLYNQLGSEELVFINLTPASFTHGCDDLHSAVFALRAAGLKPEQVVFEFVEADQFPGENALLNLVACIREAGAKIALDDFGSGHSTISMAEIIRPDIIKFDRTLLQPSDDEAKEILLESLVKFAKSLGAQTVAEGIETVAQLALAERCGFDHVQGWLVSKPAARLQRPHLGMQQSLLD